MSKKDISISFVESIDHSMNNLSKKQRLAKQYLNAKNPFEEIMQMAE